MVINYSKNPAPAETLVSRIVNGGGQAIAVGADVSDPAAVTRLFDQLS